MASMSFYDDFSFEMGFQSTMLNEPKLVHESIFLSENGYHYQKVAIWLRGPW